MRDTNVADLIAAQKPLPHGIGINPDRSTLEERIEGEHETSEGPFISSPHKAGDIFSHAYNGGGGFGDPLERDPAKTVYDVTNGFTTMQAANAVFGVVLKDDAETGDL